MASGYGHPQSEETRRKISETLSGRKLTDKTRKRLSEAKMGDKNPNYGKSMTDKCREALLKSRKGQRATKETREKMSVSIRQALQDEGIRKKMGDTHRGEKSNFWKGGVCQDEKYMLVKRRIGRHNRRALVRNSVGTYTVDEWEKLKLQYDNKCPICGASGDEIPLTLDHIVPLSKGGNNYIENIQPLCSTCNKRKATKSFHVSPNGEMILV